MLSSIVNFWTGRPRNASRQDAPKDALPMAQPRPYNVQDRSDVEDRMKQLEDQVHIQPHTDLGGDAYYIGDAYEPSKCADEWKIDTSQMPYLAHVKRVSQAMPHLEYLAHWMEVTAAPPKWKFIQKHPQNREQRAQRCKVCVMDFHSESRKDSVYENTTALRIALHDSPPSSTQQPDRLLIVEDLSRDVVELLGAQYDIDPLFFLSHIGDYLFHNTRDPWVELPDLDVTARQRPFFTLQYLRGRYFKTPEAFEKAERESGAFNVLRRLDSDRSRKRLQDGLLDLAGASVTLTRAKTSFWTRPRTEKDEPVLAILLVDPTVKEGHPLWNGHRPFQPTPSMHSTSPLDTTKRSSLFEDAIHWSKQMTSSDLEQIREDPKCMAIPMICLVLADWRAVLKYMTTMLGKIEWEFERPHWGEKPSDIDASLTKLSPWRRNINYYKAMVADAFDRLFPLDVRVQLALNQPMPVAPNADNTGMMALWHDFRLVQQLMDTSQQRLESIQTTATNSISISESRRAVQQNKNLARLTFLATIFIPLNFTSSFLSMSPDFSSAGRTIWMFFAIGFPLTALALLVVDLTHPQQGVVERWLKGWWGGRKKAEGTGSREEVRKVEVGKTMPWQMGRSRTGLVL